MTLSVTSALNAFTLMFDNCSSVLCVSDLLVELNVFYLMSDTVNKLSPVFAF